MQNISTCYRLNEIACNKSEYSSALKDVGEQFEHYFSTTK